MFLSDFSQSVKVETEKGRKAAIMKFYHLADLHFGKSIYGLSMLEDQRYWSTQFLNLCEKEKPDAVVIAGDVYDRSAPGIEAVSLLDGFLTRLSQLEIPVLLIAGNHDSGERLSFGSSIFAKENIHISGRAKRELDHVTFENPDGYGPVTFWMLPYTYPEQVCEIFEERDIRTYDQALRRLLEAQDADWKTRNVIIAHQNVTADGMEVERGGSESMVGGVGQVDYSVFDGFEYAALGHIHSAYPVGRTEVRYAGTPLAYHFSEIRQKNKGLVQVELGAKGEMPKISFLSIAPLHAMRYFSGPKEKLYEEIQKDTAGEEYVGVTITDERITPEISSYLRRLFQNRGSVLLELISTYTSFSGHAASAEKEAVETRAVEDLFSDLYTEQSGGMPPRDMEYDVMKYVGELVRHTDCHEPLDTEDVRKIIAYAKQCGGKE